MHSGQDRIPPCPLLGTTRVTQTSYHDDIRYSTVFEGVYMRTTTGQSLNALSGELLRFIAKSGENVVISPACLYLALAMLSDLTEGNTKSQINDTLGNDGEMAYTALALQNIATPKHGCRDFRYSIGASLWLNESLALNDAYPEKAPVVPSELQRVKMGAEETHKQMSTWLSENTGRLFKKPPETHGEERLIALCALYLKDAWSKDFFIDECHVFTNADSSQTEAEFIESNDHYHLLERNNSLTFASKLTSGCSMIVSLPPIGMSADSYVASGDAWANIQRYLQEEASLPYERCEIHMPKFDISSERVRLNEALGDLGITDLFSVDADFSPLTSEQLMVDEVIQNTRLRINEDGLEGASYVIAVAIAGALFETSKPRQIFVNRPFVVCVVSPDNYPLFVGVVNSCKRK